MNKKIKLLIKQVRYHEGVVDCQKGVNPQRTTRYYLQGYSEQYAKDQILNALTEPTF
jgi:hypothetical protein